MNAKRFLKPSRGWIRIAALTALAGLAGSGLCQAALTPAQAGDLWSQSLALEKSSDYKGALAKMAELSRNGTDLYLVNLRSGWLNSLNKDYGQAIINYQAAVARAPGAVTPLLGLATAYRANGDNDNAERVARQVVARDSGNVTALEMLGAIYFEKKDYQSAAVTYDTLLKLYPEDTTALSGSGWAKIYLGRKAEAIPAFQRLLILSPTYEYAQQGYTTATTP